MSAVDSIPEEIAGFYSSGLEETRFSVGYFPLELTRTKELLERWLPPPPARVVDVGGGPGVYARWLTCRGYEVHLIDPVERLVDIACSEGELRERPASAQVADARQLPWPDRWVGVALLLGPLYHLSARHDRLLALHEARRVLVSGGLVVAAAISRLSPVVESLIGGPSGRPEALPGPREGLSLIAGVVRNGRYRNPTGDPRLFTTAYMHWPAELRSEAEEAGLEVLAVVAIEGPVAWIPGFAHLWKRPRSRVLLGRAASAAAGPAWLSPHMALVARRPAGR
jgi:SAM-dependent methyltransferase